MSRAEGMRKLQREYLGGVRYQRTIAGPAIRKAPPSFARLPGTPRLPQDDSFRTELRYVLRDARMKAAIAERETARRPLPCRVCEAESRPRSPYCAEHS